MPTPEELRREQELKRQQEEAAARERAAAVKRQEELAVRNRLSGTANAGEKEEEDEESPKDYMNNVMKGGLNEKATEE